MKKLLHGRLLCTSLLTEDAVSKTFLGRDEDDCDCLIRVWPFDPDRLDTAVRTLWSREERRLCRLASLSEAEDSLLTHCDGGLDYENGVFVMALSTTGGGFQPLAEQLQARQHELAFNSLHKPSLRSPIWEGLAQIARGIHLMHRQRILHQSIGAETVFTDPAVGPSSWRLGGFDWAFRFGSEKPAMVDGPRWTGRPAALQDGVSFAADWYQFGTLAARIFCNLESIGGMSADQRHDILLREVENGGQARITQREKALILRLLGFRAADRLIAGEHLIEEIHGIAHGLSAGTIELNVDLPLVLVFNPNNQRLTDACQDAGFYPTEDKLTPFVSRDVSHVAALRDFLQKDLSEALLQRLPGGEKAILCGTKLSYFITRFDAERRDGVAGKPTWDFARIADPSHLSGSDPESQRDLRGLKILPVSHYDLQGIGRSQPWTTVLPAETQFRDNGLTRDLARMHDFVRCTNQLDLLFTSARIYPFEALQNERSEEGQTEEDGWECLTVRETSREVELPTWASSNSGLAGMLMEEFSSGKDKCRLVLLTDHSRLSTGDKPLDEEWWEGFMESDGQSIRLRRRAVPGRVMPILRNGFIRTYGLYGQFSLVDRRQRAIDRLKDHRFLLRTMANPRCRDSKVFNENLPIPEWLESKEAVMQDVERVRPIYALQGPPGTGKTTFESQHLRRVFEDHPEAQVLVTAQAHTAVDVLRRKIREEAFKDREEDACPLSIRLGRRDDGHEDRDSIQTVTRRLLAASSEAMKTLTARTAVQERWLQFLERAASSQSAKDEDALVRAMQQLLKSGAAITYCTTSASDLAALAESSEFDHNYDLVIVEESGRVHAFDLALPLEAGHRWLLLGDHEQLPPFQIRQFEDALKHLDQAMEALERLGELERTDSKWVERWEKLNQSEKTIFQAYALDRLRYFKWLHETLGGKNGENATKTEVKGSGAGMLTVQFRMHPHICDIISRAFYKGLLTTDPKSLDGEGNHKPAFRHQLRLAGMPPELDIQNRAIVWIDLPWCANDHDFEETGQKQGKLNYRNYPEARAVRAFIERLQPTEAWDHEHSIAVLTPYRQQIIALQDEFRGVRPPPFLELVSSLGARKPEERSQWVHTVDSFQGNEADVIVTSLVRNNTATTVHGAIGFMADFERLNVMLSRSKQLLVLVGSWDFFAAQAEYAKEGDDAWYLKVVLKSLSEYFAMGQAVKIQMTQLTALDIP